MIFCVIPSLCLLCVILFSPQSLIGTVCCSRYFQTSYLYLDDPVKTRVPLTCDPGWELEGPGGAAAPIPAEAFPLHVARLHADTDIGQSNQTTACLTFIFSRNYRDLSLDVTLE